jgi:lipopolysaccharide export system ATP-binding protein
MVDGKLFKSGTAEELANDPKVRKVYLGQNFKLKRARVGTPDLETPEDI